MADVTKASLIQESNSEFKDYYSFYRTNFPKECPDFDGSLTVESISVNEISHIYGTEANISGTVSVGEESHDFTGCLLESRHNDDIVVKCETFDPKIIRVALKNLFHNLHQGSIQDWIELSEEIVTSCDPNIYENGAPLLNVNAGFPATREWISELRKVTGFEHIDWHYENCVGKVLFLDDGSAGLKERLIQAAQELTGMSVMIVETF